MSNQVMLVMVNATDNNNKFYELTELPNGSVQARYGRIGGSETTRTYPAGSFHAKKNEKIRKGYVVREQAGNAPRAAVTGLDAADRVNKALFNGHACAASKKFAEVLLRNNRHAIEDATGGKIQVNKSTGSVSTALGPVTAAQLVTARALLSDIKNGSRRTYVIEQYLTIIPQRIANVRAIDAWLTPSWIREQDALLDSLDSALAAATTPSDNDSAAPIPFRNKLALLDENSDEFREVNERFKKSVNAGHTSASKKLVRVWKITDTAAWDAQKATLKHHRTLWHGTTAGNVLSILRAGLICPPSTDGRYATTGRMFGDGVYFSDQSTKSLNYAVGVWSNNVGSGNPMMFLADVVMGREYRPTTGGYAVPREARTSKDDKGRSYNSIFVRGGTCGVRNNEMIVWNTDQIKLTYLCEFS